MEGIKGFKVFNPDWTCMGFQYEVGQTYEEQVIPSVCDKGFHFCKQSKDCFNYYSFNPENKVAEVLAIGEISEDGDKCCTNKIQIVREIPWGELLSLVNLGKGNAGLCNSGNRNSGNRNSGDCNSGDWNKASNVAGCFNTEQHKLIFFDKTTDITFEQWRRSDACYLLSQVDFRPTEWIYEEYMSDEEKAAHPDYKTTGGYLKVRDNKDYCIEWWNGLTDRHKNIIKSIPNFDADKFFAITGIKV